PAPLRFPARAGGARRRPGRVVGPARGAAASSSALRRRRPGRRHGRVRGRRRAAVPRERRGGPDARAPPRATRRARGMTIPVTGVSELVLEVDDLRAAERFYSGVLGLPVVERWAERKAIWVMAGDRTRIGLWRPQGGVAGGRGGEHVHFALHVTDDAFDAAVARLREAGLDPFVQDRRRDSRSVYVDDPDGNCVELWTKDVADYLPHFDRKAAEWDASYDAPTTRGHWQRARLEAAVRLVGDGPGSL